MGFEPTYVGFANRCLTAWLPHHRSNGVPSGPSRHTPGRLEGQQLLAFETAASPPTEKKDFALRFSQATRYRRARMVDRCGF